MNLVSKDILSDFPISDKIYLNNASVSLMPNQSIEAMKEFLVTYNSIGPDSKDSEPFVTEKLRNVRKTISKIISCQPDEIILTQSTTDGINFVANGLSFENDSNIIIRGMSHEHHANFYPWIKLKEKISIKNLPIDINGFFKLDDLESYLDNNTKLVALSHALYNTGSILPVETIGKILHDKVPFFIDGAQSIGCIEDVDVSRIQCDFMSFNGSKWLCGPMGTGLFYCNRKSSELLEPKTIGGESAMIYDDSKIAYKELPDKFQAGFRNYVGIVGLESSANYLLNFGIRNIREKNQYLSNLFREELSKIPNVILYGPEDPNDRTSIISFNIKGSDSQEIVDKLEKQNIVLSVREIMEKKIVRASPHFFNTESQILKVIDAIKKL
ncbi:MAG: aminotransferase class V-fold PLP-dependent enzyme [Nitrosopumilus sp.]|uniref:aminotransferase class V-fold PLP-dependent enzyme n=1 Tax=Nitrosopumilus sp. TaxID=2024843 RepID=UPI0024707B73|nr:aminotransferase class V-fold PLP-dependent enzyme [Nitrosopumilus sp.]MDH5430604.1 aminotransferase class V-fold PLP-dependent enzyme [Nitrosopumilus sp.]MDH5665576.1 aminotransferase class V-fold PLP-dependent enzyme [Nitrosopumilus sp.]MDH5697310.1 aminotransferase class V-fold PLP-dependent enzyme [Nitrosopumilus sp.]